MCQVPLERLNGLSGFGGKLNPFNHREAVCFYMTSSFGTIKRIIIDVSADSEMFVFIDLVELKFECDRHGVS